MLELIGNAANIALAETLKGTLAASIEVVLLVSEPRYSVDVAGYTKIHNVQDFRFTTSADGLRKLANTFADLAADAEILERRAKLEPTKSAA